MDDAAMTAYITTAFEGVETTESFGYTLFFYGSDRRIPFATIISADTEHDRMSNLNRPGVYRLNFGIGRQSFETLFRGTVNVADYDYTAVNVIMPHPEYSAQRYVCVLSPSGEVLQQVRELLAEAYGIAVQRSARRQP